MRRRSFDLTDFGQFITISYLWSVINRTGVFSPNALLDPNASKELWEESDCPCTTVSCTDKQYCMSRKDAVDYKWGFFFVFMVTAAVLKKIFLLHVFGFGSRVCAGRSSQQKIAGFRQTSLTRRILDLFSSVLQLSLLKMKRLSARCPV